MARWLHSLLLMLLGGSVIDSLAVGESSPLPDGRFDKNGKHYRVEMVVHRES